MSRSVTLKRIAAVSGVARWCAETPLRIHGAAQFFSGIQGTNLVFGAFGERAVLKLSMWLLRTAASGAGSKPLGFGIGKLKAIVPRARCCFCRAEVVQRI